MKNRRLLLALLISPVAGAAFSMLGAEAAPCGNYGGCAQLEITPPKPADTKPAPSPPAAASTPKPPAAKPATVKAAPKQPEQKSARKQPADRDRNLQRRSTSEERAETRALNLEASGGSGSRATVVNRSDDYFRIHRQYQQDLRDYRAALRAYQFRTRFHAPPPGGGTPYRPATPLPPGTNAPAGPPASSYTDQERFDPWHGYNSGPGNGY